MSVFDVYYNVMIDMGMGQADGSLQPIHEEYPSLNTSRLVMEEVNNTDFILHIGDISYARGYAGVVSVLTFLL